MKSTRIASSMLKGISILLSLSQLYLQQSRLSYMTKLVLFFACVLQCISLRHPSSKTLTVLLLLQSIYVAYCSFIQKRESMSMLNEDQAKHIFLLFFVLFNAVFNDFKVAVYTFYMICIEFRFIVMSVFNFAFILVTGVLSFFISDNNKKVIIGRVSKCDETVKKTQ